MALFILKNAIAAFVATLIWFVADYSGAHPRPFDWWLLFFIEYTGITVYLLRKRLGDL